MIPYETVRYHLERRHWIATLGVSWSGLVAIHEQDHRTHEDDPHHDFAATPAQWADIASPRDL